MQTVKSATKGTTLRVGLADDHLIIRSGVRQFLSEQEGIQVVGECGSGRGAIDLVRTIDMDVLVLDISMPDQTGVDCMAMIRAKAPDVGILVLSSYPMEQYALTVLRLGARGFLNKQCEPEEILDAILAIASGKRYIQPELMDLLARHAEHKDGVPLHNSLTEREFQIMLKLAKGLSSGVIGDELSLSSKTVSTYRTHLLKKMEVRTNSALTRYAMDHKLID